MDNKSDVTLFAKYFCDLDYLRKNWAWFLFMGIVFIVLGIVAIATSTAVTMVSVILLGSILLIGGIVQIFYAFWAHEWSGFFLSILAGILYGITGLLIVRHPAAGALSLTLLLAAFYMIGGIFRIISATVTRFEQWGWAVFSGVITFLLGLLIWNGWPETGLWVFGLFIGIDLIVYGWFWVILSLTARKESGLIRR